MRLTSLNKPAVVFIDYQGAFPYINTNSKENNGKMRARDIWKYTSIPDLEITFWDITYTLGFLLGVAFINRNGWIGYFA